MKYTTETFIAKAKIVHGNKYDYSKCKYNGSHEKVCIICPEHGEFWQTASNHLSGQACPKCSHRSFKKNTEEFIAESKKIHGNKYDYSKVVYLGNYNKICIICPEHGEFWQTPHNHLNGHGCPRCQKNHNRYTESTIKDAFMSVHGNKYDYSKMKYLDNRIKVIIVCPEHGDFLQTPSKHLQGQGCPKCGNKIVKVKSIEQFIKEAKEIHGDKYDYSKVEYENANKKVCIICSKHGEFWQTPHHHLMRHGCPMCSESLMCVSISRLLEKNGIFYEREKTFPWLKNTKSLFLDFYLPDYNMAIECNGIQHFEPVDHFGGKKRFIDGRKCDIEKHNSCEKNGIKIVYFTTVKKFKEENYPYKVFTNEKDLIDSILIN